MWMVIEGLAEAEQTLLKPQGWIRWTLAAVVVLGLAFDTVLALLSLPALYLLYGKDPSVEATESAVDESEDIETQNTRTPQEAFA
jgi:hypothetical protein